MASSTEERTRNIAASEVRAGMTVLSARGWQVVKEVTGEDRRTILGVSYEGGGVRYYGPDEPVSVQLGDYEF